MAEPPSDFTGVWRNDSPADGSYRLITYRSGRKHGLWQCYLRNGVVHRECNLEDGQYHGEMTTRDSSGEVLDRSVFDHGTGIYRIFMSSGKLAWEIPLANGRRHGVVRRWNVRGEIVLEEEYSGGELVQRTIDRVPPIPGAENSR